MRVVVPDGVIGELTASGAPERVREWLADRPAWLEVMLVPADRVASISDHLDLGERAAIALAEILAADLLLIDDAAG